MATAIETPWIVEQARALGFDLCGVVATPDFPEIAHFKEWIARGYQGEMKYLADPRRQDPSLAFEPLRSVVVCGLNYNTAHPYSVDATGAITDPSRGWISRYAWGSDYHEVLWKKLNALELLLKREAPESFTSHAYADTGPIAERVLAKYAGLGWLGKNTLLLNENLGSWFFLGVILTSMELVPSLAAMELPPADLCGNCRQCLDACPTGALVEPYVMDARRCISYLTIELRGSIAQEFRERMGWQVYGCDICQDVCPYNRKAPSSPPEGISASRYWCRQVPAPTRIRMACQPYGIGVSSDIPRKRNEEGKVEGYRPKCLHRTGERWFAAVQTGAHPGSQYLGASGKVRG